MLEGGTHPDRAMRLSELERAMVERTRARGDVIALWVRLEEHRLREEDAAQELRVRYEARLRDLERAERKVLQLVGAPVA